MSDFCLIRFSDNDLGYKKQILEEDFSSKICHISYYTARVIEVYNLFYIDGIVWFVSTILFHMN